MATGGSSTPSFGVAAISATPHISLQLKRFAGKHGENPDAFLKSIRMAKNAGNWTDAQTLYYAGLHSSGKYRAVGHMMVGIGSTPTYAQPYVTIQTLAVC